ncbi:MAG: ABC transporter substrate-binding protein, partial [Gammaproteobacteria bacterium]|nr:ABC transporter substrate-binding protein [Gammaproteobacteria bacterium]
TADIMMIGWRSDTEDSANFFEFLAMTPNPSTGMGAYNAGNYSSEYVDQMTVQSNAETDPKKRAEMLQGIEARIYQDAAFIPLHWENLAWAARKGVRIAPIVNAFNLPYLGDLVID